MTHVSISSRSTFAGILLFASVAASNGSLAAFVDSTTNADWAALPPHQETALTPVDIDGDDDLDVAIAHRGVATPLGPVGLRLYKNDGSGNFSDITPGTDLEFLPPDVGPMSWADFDNDGDQDLAVRLSGRLELHENQPTPSGDPTFDEIMEFPGNWGIGTWADVDNDGDLDLYLMGQPGEASRLYRNDLVPTGVLAFTDVTTASGLVTPASDIPLSAAWGDVDNDGDPDLYIANSRGHPNQQPGSPQPVLSESDDRSDHRTDL